MAWVVGSHVGSSDLARHMADREFAGLLATQVCHYLLKSLV